MNRRIFFLIDKKDIYQKILSESISDELEEIKIEYINSVKDIFRSDIIIVCGDGDFDKKSVLALNILKKPLILYHMSPDAALFSKLARRAKWVVPSGIVEGYNYFPSPVLLGDLDTPRHIERIWGRERLASKRGCIGIIGLKLGEEQRSKLVDALNLLIEDIDINVVFAPILKEESIKDILSGIKYSANVRLIQSEKYSSKELLGIINRLDLLVTSSEKAVFCAMAVEKPIVGLSVDDELEDFFSNLTKEEILFDIDKLTSDELYSRIKIAWVHRDSIAKDIKIASSGLKKQAAEGIKRLEKELA